jgi:hypothetical protein
VIDVSEIPRSELDPKFFSESWVKSIYIIGEVCWKETHYPPTHDILTKEIVQ